MRLGTIRQIIALLALTCSISAASRAGADVIEIEANGYRWVTGGQAAVSASPAPETRGADTPVGVLTQTGRQIGPQAWSGHVHALAEKYDLSPALIEALVWQESRWRPSAVSSAGAIGLAQLMPGTARELAVDPYDPVANLDGGARYLRMQLNAFDGDLERALAAYNAGAGRVLRAKGIPRIPETQAYVAAIMARLSEPVRR
ncbi:MAG: lytic transglycosylase domain-containing protein [Novosphingobium sp.]